MKSTERLIDNIANEDFRKSKIDLQQATNHILKNRVEKEKQKIINQIAKK